jgi:hypothetical protein
MSQTEESEMTFYGKKSAVTTTAILVKGFPNCYSNNFVSKPYVGNKNLNNKSFFSQFCFSRI